LRKLLDRLAQWQVTVYCTDHWEAYASELEKHPEAHHVETKTDLMNGSIADGRLSLWVERGSQSRKTLSNGH